jgi:hypothetical protein
MIGGPCQRSSSGYAALQDSDAVREDDEYGYHRRYSGVMHKLSSTSHSRTTRARTKRSSEAQEEYIAGQLTVYFASGQRCALHGAGVRPPRLLRQ